MTDQLLILSVIEHSPMHVDEISKATGLNRRDVTLAALDMIQAGVCVHDGGKLSRADAGV